MQEILEYFAKHIKIFHPIILGLGGILGIVIRRWYNDFRLSGFKSSDHTIFINLRSSIRDVKSWIIKENREVFREMIIKKFDFWYIEGFELCKRLDKVRLSNQQLIHELSAFEDMTIDKYVGAWKEMQVPDIAIAVFNDLHQKKIDAFQVAIMQIALNDSMYRTYKAKVIAIFNKLDTLLIDTKLDLMTICTQTHFNGRFAGATYKNIPISDIEYQKLKDVNVK